MKKIKLPLGSELQGMNGPFAGSLSFGEIYLDLSGTIVEENGMPYWLLDEESEKKIQTIIKIDGI